MMKWKTYLQLFCFFLLSHQLAFADTGVEDRFVNQHLRFKKTCKRHHKQHRRHNKKCCCQTCQLGTARFTAPDPSFWYAITTFGYPTTTVLSVNRNQGSTQGAVGLTPTGLILGEAGNYSVNFTAVLSNPENQEDYTLLVPVFLAINGVFDPNNPLVIGNTVTLPFGFISSVQANGILENVVPGTTLSLVATNAGSPEPQPVTVISWDINVFKIPCESNNDDSDKKSCGCK